MSKLLVVLGATGQQGGSIIRTVLQDTQLRQEYRIRAIVRDPTSEKALALQKDGVDLFKADVNDPSTLRPAFEGAHTVFGNTITIYDGKTLEHELEQGRAIADAAVSAKAPHFIWSTLPSPKKLSGGKLKDGGHFDGKEEVEQYIRTLPIKSAFVSPGSFMSNFSSNMGPRLIGDDTYTIANFVDPTTEMPLLDTAGDFGKWVAAILADFTKYEGKILSAATAAYSFHEIVATFAKVSGKKVVYTQVPKDAWRSYIPEVMRDHLTDMFVQIQDYGYYGEGTKEKIEWSASQARGKLTTFEEYLRTHRHNLK